MRPSAAVPEAIGLPGGLVLGEDRRLEDAELRPLTGRDEDWLASHPALPSAIAVTRVLSSCLIRIGDAKPTRNLVRRLLVGDRDYLILQLRRLTLGDEFQAVFRCPACGGNLDVNFDAKDVPVSFRPQVAADHSIPLGSAAEAERTVRFRLPCGADQEAVLGLDPNRGAEALLDRCVLDNGGIPLSLSERDAIVDAMDHLAPQVDLELDLACPECGNQFVAPFDTTAFFFSEIKINGGQLLREIHSLAFYYHWSEAEIMGLPRDRRRTYLGLLSDALRQE
jgi:predicted RNA-binding Zn-ribbon protein involved in translation (DUF1610 family)